VIGIAEKHIWGKGRGAGVYAKESQLNQILIALSLLSLSWLLLCLLGVRLVTTCEPVSYDDDLIEQAHQPRSCH
jgi:hypothetical protein